MQANKIYPGTDYAYGYRGRGAPLPLDAKRVKVLEIIKEEIFGRSRDRTYCRVQVLTDEGMPNGAEPVKVRAREILEFWDEYIETVSEAREARKQRIEEQRKRDEEYKRERDERAAITAVAFFFRNGHAKGVRMEQERKEMEEREAKTRRYTRMRNVLIARGFTPGKITIMDNYDSVGRDSSVVIDLDEMERWLGFDK